MTISGALPNDDVHVDSVNIITASKAQNYISSLVPELEKIDGSPVWFVDDGETGTSDILVSDALDALWENGNINKTNLNKILMFCFNNDLSFRLWLADNNPLAYLENTEKVTSYEEAIEMFKNSGIYHHANKAPQPTAKRGG